jgi:hypothetical protein
MQRSLLRRARDLAGGARVVAALLCLVLWAPLAVASSNEYLIKAAYLYHFAMFVDWPAEAFASKTAPIVIGIVGSDPFGSALDATIRDKRIDGRPVLVKRLDWKEDLRQCHLVFLAAADSGRIGDLVRRLDGAPVLIVAESQDLARRGAAISFRIDDNRVRFDINVDAAKRHRLTISSKVLNLARIVTNP